MADEELNDRLARLRAEQAAAGESAPQGVISKAAALWKRYSRRRKRGDALLALTAVLIVGIVLAALVVLVVNAVGGGDSNPASAVSAPTTPTDVRPPTPTATPALIATTAPPLPIAPAPAVRQDCDAIRGTNYESEEERVYFQENCLDESDPSDGDVGAPLSNPTRPPNAPTTGPAATAPPAATPTPSASNAGSAIGLAIGWLRGRSPSYVADAGSCNALQASDHWVVTCNARVAGCQGPACETTMSVCVLSDLSAVRPSDQC